MVRKSSIAVGVGRATVVGKIVSSNNRPGLGEPLRHRAEIVHNYAAKMRFGWKTWANKALQRAAAPLGWRTVRENLLATVATDRAFPAVAILIVRRRAHVSGGPESPRNFLTANLH